LAATKFPLAPVSIVVHSFRAKATESNQMQSRIIAALTMALFFFATCSSSFDAANAQTGASRKDQRAVLIFSHTTGFRHKSVEAGTAAMAELIRAKGMLPVVSEDISIFQQNRLSPYRAIIFVSNTTSPKSETTDWLVGDAATNFKAWLGKGGAVIGIHAASDSHYFQPWYGTMIGGWFKSHPPGTYAATLKVENAAHPSTRMLPKSFVRTDEWYAFKDFDPEVTLLVTLDPVSIGQPAGPAWPVSWSRQYGGGRIFYTSMGHTIDSFSEPLFLQHVEGGFDWAVGKK
jgi:uncharacterized protein